jgi:hypothetical protein
MTHINLQVVFFTGNLAILSHLNSRRGVKVTPGNSSAISSGSIQRLIYKSETAISYSSAVIGRDQLTGHTSFLSGDLSAPLPQKGFSLGRAQAEKSSSAQAIPVDRERLFDQREFQTPS